MLLRTIPVERAIEHDVLGKVRGTKDQPTDRGIHALTREKSHGSSRLDLHETCISRVTRIVAGRVGSGRVCVIEHRCVWSYSYVPTYKYIACTRVQTMSIYPNSYNTTLEAPGTPPLAMLLCGFFWGSNRNHYYLLLVLVMHPLATFISMYVRVPAEIQ